MPRTIVMVHGAWVTPGCWDRFKPWFESRGYTVLAPPWPYEDRPLEELRGVLPGPKATRANFHVLLSWRGWRKVHTKTFESFRWGFCHTLPEAEARDVYDRYVIPTPGRIFYQAATGAGTKVNYANPSRAPLLITGGQLDRAVDAMMTRSNFRKYRHSPAVTEYKEFPGRTHWLISSPGWQEVAEHAATWIERNLPTT